MSFTAIVPVAEVEKSLNSRRTSCKFLNLIEESPLIGAVLMRCAEKHIPFSELDEEEQNLIRDYANIFKKDARERMNTLLTVTA